MFVGVMRFSVQIVGARSLKDKRSVIRSLKERAQSRLRVSIAEVGALDHPQHATLGVACVSNEASVCDGILADVARMASTLPDAVLTDRATEIIPMGDGGRGVTGGIEQALPHDAREPSQDDEDEWQR
jgi:uncharacterized protein YlxP (DUF503 family)